MTQDVDKSRIANAATQPEIEITEEMIAAGEDVLLGELGGAVSSHWLPDVLAKEVYLAMATCSPKVRGQSRRQISQD
jgi:hypothetical protein